MLILVYCRMKIDQLNFVCKLAEDTKKAGRKFLTGGERSKKPGYFFPITLVADITDGA